MRIGFIGTGTISAAVVEGLQSLDNAPEIVVSPRSDAVSAALAARFPKVQRATSNAEAAAADIVFLGMRPAQVDEALEGVTFGAGQIVVSMVAGFALSEIATRWPLAAVCRLVPLPGIARRVGPIAMYPALPPIIRLVEPLGDLFVVDSESQLYFGGLSAFMSSYFQLQHALIDAGTEAGVAEADARRYVISMLGMLADTGSRASPSEFATLVEGHQTKGGLNARVREQLLAAGWFDAPRAALLASTTLDRSKLG